MCACAYNAYKHYYVCKTAKQRSYFELDPAKLNSWMDVNTYGSDWLSDPSNQRGEGIAR